MTARYQCTDLPAWTHTGLGYRTARVLIEATQQPDVVSVDGARFEVVEVGIGMSGHFVRAMSDNRATLKTTPEEAATSVRGLTTSTTHKESKEGL